jgi:hypothetical protein
MTARDETDLFCDICTDERGIDLQTLEQMILLTGPVGGLHLKGPYSTRASEQMMIARKKGTMQKS